MPEGNYQDSGEQTIQLGRQEELVRIQTALKQRPRVSIRMRIVAVFMMLFVLMSVVTVAAVILLKNVRKKLVFFERMGDVVFEIQQARRFEKNFFLYGTNLQDAIDNVSTAHQHLEKARNEIASVVDEKVLQSLLGNIDTYQRTLDSLLERQANSGEIHRLESSLRKYGSQIVGEAEDLLERERLAMHSILEQLVIFSLVFLGFMLVALMFFAGFTLQSALRPLGRFLRYAERIAAGDFSPIRPARKYRDEFTNLALAINHMLHELLKRQEQLVHSEKMAVVGKLTAGIAHELNNPLNNISLSVDALLEGQEGMSPEQTRRILEQISNQVDRASGTVRNLLDFTRRQQQAFTTLDLNWAITSAAKLVENERKLAGIDLELHLQDDLPPVKGDPRGMEQVFLNLFLNAIQALKDGGKLTVSSSLEGSQVRVDVTDNGPGIPQENLEAIFEPFFTTKNEGMGTGLGLSICSGIVEKHQGRLTVSSQVGAGSTFSVYLPLRPSGKEQEKTN